MNEQNYLERYKSISGIDSWDPSGCCTMKGSIVPPKITSIWLWTDCELSPAKSKPTALFFSLTKREPESPKSEMFVVSICYLNVKLPPG